MALPGDARIVIDVPGAAEDRRAAVLTVGRLGDDCEVGDTRTYLLTIREEAVLNFTIAGLLAARNQECGPQL